MKQKRFSKSIMPGLLAVILLGAWIIPSCSTSREEINPERDSFLLLDSRIIESLMINRYDDIGKNLTDS